MGRAMAAAFKKEPNFRYMLPEEHRRERRLAWFFGSFVARLGLRYGEVFAPRVARGGAVWMRPGAKVTAWGGLKAGVLMMPYRLGIQGARRATALGEHVEALREAVAPSMHWYLVALGVHPGDQGRGVGQALLQPVLTRADREHVPCYLETFRERTASFYRRLGFEVVRKDAVPDGGPEFFCMSREPRTSREERRT